MEGFRDIPKGCLKTAFERDTKGGISEKRSIFERASLTAIDYVQTLPNEAKGLAATPKQTEGQPIQPKSWSKTAKPCHPRWSP